MFESLDNEVKMCLPSCCSLDCLPKYFWCVKVLKTNGNPTGVAHCRMQMKVNSSVGVAGG